MATMNDKIIKNIDVFVYGSGAQSIGEAIDVFKNNKDLADDLTAMFSVSLDYIVGVIQANFTPEQINEVFVN